jgi:hypothetical protein
MEEPSRGAKMSLKSLRLVCTVGVLSIAPSALAQSMSDVYLNQADPSTRGGGVYLNQVPETARPVAPPRAAAPARKRPAQTAAAPIVPARAAGNLPRLPDVGAGVALALSPAAADERFPSIGRGVGGN